MPFRLIRVLGIPAGWNLGAKRHLAIRFYGIINLTEINGVVTYILPRSAVFQPSHLQWNSETAFNPQCKHRLLLFVPAPVSCFYAMKASHE